MGMRSPKTFPVDVVSKSFSGGDECCAEKLENSAVRYLVGCALIGHRGRRSRRVVAGLLSEVKRAGAHVPNCSVTDCDGCIERKLSSNGNTPHMSVKEEDREAVLRVAGDGTESQTERAFAVRGYPLEVVVCERNLLSGFLMDSCIPKSERGVSSDRSEDQGRQEFDVLNRQ